MLSINEKAEVILHIYFTFSRYYFKELLKKRIEWSLHLNLWEPLSFSGKNERKNPNDLITFIFFTQTTIKEFFKVQLTFRLQFIASRGKVKSGSGKKIAMGSPFRHHCHYFFFFFFWHDGEKNYFFIFMANDLHFWCPFLLSLPIYLFRVTRLLFFSSPFWLAFNESEIWEIFRLLHHGKEMYQNNIRRGQISFYH